MEKDEPFCIISGMQAGAVTVESNMEIPPKLKIALLFDPVIPFLGIYLKERKTLIQNNVSTPMFIAALFIIAKIGKQPKCPSVDEWIKQLWYIYTMEYYLAMKKKEILTFVTTWMDLEGIILSEISQSEKKTNTV